MAQKLNITQGDDAQAVVNILHSNSSSNLLINPLIAKCRKILELIYHKQVKHVFRKENQCTNFLTNLGLQQQCPLSLLSSPPLDVLSFLSFDLSYSAKTRY